MGLDRLPDPGPSVLFRLLRRSMSPTPLEAWSNIVSTFGVYRGTSLAVRAVANIRLPANITGGGSRSFPQNRACCDKASKLYLEAPNAWP